jgi:hypothetical protein
VDAAIWTGSAAAGVVLATGLASALGWTNAARSNSTAVTQPSIGLAAPPGDSGAAGSARVEAPGRTHVRESRPPANRQATASAAARGTTGASPPGPVDSAGATSARGTAWLDVHVPAGATLWIDGTRREVAGTARLAIRPGPHVVALTVDSVGYRDRRSLTLRPDGVGAVRFELPNGRLTLRAEPWADVVIDGKPAGRTPLDAVALPIGQHTVVFSNPELGSRRYEVGVRAGAPTRLAVDLRR